MTNLEKRDRLFELLSELDVYNRAIGKLSFDQECCAPPEGLDQAGEDMAFLGKRVYEITHSDEYVTLLRELYEDGEGLSLPERKGVEHRWESYLKTKNFTPEFSYESDLAFNRAYGAWLSAKQNASWEAYKPAFIDVVEYTKKAIDLRDEKKATYYDSCLDDFEKGGSAEQLDSFFSALKARIVPLLKRIVEEGKPIREDFMSRPVEISKQEELSRYLLEKEGLRKSALVLMTTEHPFTTSFGPKDVRVTTHYYEDNFVSNIFSTLHEGGHAMFMQNEPEEFCAAHADNFMSNAMHETISRFYENIVGRSEAFIHFIYPEFQRISEGVFADVTERELYEAVNVARPSLIRIEADELSYSLHILIRYELEKAILNGELAYDDIPAAWNAKYKEYLGVTVPSDDQGCLQDVHWTGMFGYFPSYALGNAYGAQILKTMEKDFDVFAAIEAGELDKIAAWLKEKVYSIASITDPDDWIVSITGESLNTDYYLDYLEEKFTKIYDLK